MLLAYDFSKDLYQMRGYMDDFFLGSQDNNEVYYPLANVLDSDEEVKVYTYLSGVNPKSLDIVYKDKVLSIKGKRDEDIESGAKCLGRERAFSSFKKELKISFAVDSESIKANYKKGVLEVSLKKAEEAKPLKIEIK
jgi:HSP20 family protein